ncbi:MAG: N-acetylmuramoyl-L-alanine amidase [Lachnospiraceae bacterium]|nr:N-acetylmuramoyl-L-alanine amidase [Lachnospiraceae bacterium]
MDRKRIAMMAGLGVTAALVLALIAVVILRALGVISVPFVDADATKAAVETTLNQSAGSTEANAPTEATVSSAEETTEIAKSGLTEPSTEEETSTEDASTEDETEDETTDETEESTEETAEESTEETKEPPTYRFVEPLLHLEAGEEQMSGLVCSDPTAPPVPVYWSSANPEIADIIDGMIYAKSEGVTTLTAKLEGQEITCQVQVHEPTLLVYINYSYLNLLPGEKKQLAVGVEPADTKQNIALSWQSSNTKVATVDGNGVVTAKKAGTARIVGHVGKKYEVYCDVVVEAKLESLTFIDGNITMQPGQTRFLPVSVVPVEAATGKAIVWQSSKPEVATVDQGGNVYALSPGNATISVFVGDDYTACVVMVKEPATQAPTQPPTEVPTEPPTQPPTEAPTEPPTEESLPVETGNGEESSADVPTEEPTLEPVTEPPTEAPTSPPEETLPPETPAESDPGETSEVIETEPETDPIPEVPLPPAPKVTLVFDAGHGGKFVGSTSGAGQYMLRPDGFQYEKDLTLLVALMAKTYIEDHYEGVTVVMTRTTDTQLSMDQVEDLKLRCAIASQVGANAMISFHFNAVASHTASGAVVLCSQKPTVAATSAGIGNCVLDELEKLGIGRRGVATKLLGDTGLDYYAINRHCAAYDIPGIIIENCFYDNPAEVPFFDSEAALMNLAIADVKGIAKYYGLREK